MARRLEIFSVGGKRREARATAISKRRRSRRPSAAASGPPTPHLELRVGVTAGVHTVAVTFPQRPAVQGEDLRPPYLRSYAVLSDFDSGQPHVAASPSPARSMGGRARRPAAPRVFACRPASQRESAACAAQDPSTLARRAYRRPVTDADLEPLLGFYEAGRKAAAASRPASRRALQRLLVEPRVPRPHRARSRRSSRRPPIPRQRPRARLAAVVLSLEQHSRRRAARRRPERGRLKRSGGAGAPGAADARRPARRRRSSNNFAGQWLYLRNVPSTRPDTQLFPDFDDNLRQAFRRETELLLRQRSCARTAASLDLLDARLHVRERAARAALRHAEHLRQPLPAGDVDRRRSARRAARAGQHPDGHRRIPNRTSPVLRGKWILENILGAPPPPPPPNVPELQERKRGRARCCRCASAWCSTARTRSARAATRAWIRSASRSRISTPIGQLARPERVERADRRVRHAARRHVVQWPARAATGAARRIRTLRRPLSRRSC